VPSEIHPVTQIGLLYVYKHASLLISQVPKPFQTPIVPEKIKSDRQTAGRLGHKSRYLVA